MKKLMIALAAVFIVAIPLAAETETVGGIEWNYTVSGGEATIYKGKNSSAIPTSTTGEITIPSTLGGYPVTSIGPSAFYVCSKLTNVVFCSCVVSIGDSAFWRCSGLTSVTIPNNVTSIGNSVFGYCNRLTNVVFGSSVTSIGYGVFSGCNSLTSMMIPDGVTSIGASAFHACSKLTSVTIPNSVTNIGSSAFRYCSRLASMTIPDSVASIGDDAFHDCSDLTGVMIPDSVTNIGNRAFRNCSRLTSVTIPSSVETIGDFVFENCIGLTSATIPRRMTSIGGGMFFLCRGLTSVTIGNGVASIGGSAFGGCSGLTSVMIPNSVTSIGSSAFDGCSGLTNVTFMGDAPTVGSSVFSDVNSNCVALVSPKSTGWGVGVGEKWNALTLQYWPELLTTVASDAEVGEIVATFADKDLAEQVSTVAEYNAFRSWVNGNNLYQPDVVANTNATIAYLLGSERLFVKQPTIEIGDVSVGENGTQGTEEAKGTMSVSVTVKDGEDSVKCATEKVAGMFEATGDLGDWDGVSKLAPTVIPETGDGATMRFKVTPGDGTASRAFLRVRVK